MTKQLTTSETQVSDGAIVEKASLMDRLFEKRLSDGAIIEKASLMDRFRFYGGHSHGGAQCKSCGEFAEVTGRMRAGPEGEETLRKARLAIEHLDGCLENSSQ